MMKCPNCEGCGKVDDLVNGEPWSFWESLPPERNAAVVMGLVKPVDCPECGGTGEVDN